MASPRIFISSTCYDLQEIRNNLRNFIKEFYYEPVMSDYGDVFYEFDLNVQDSCLKEIEKSQMYVLIVGNNYGSTYHREAKDEESPDSITLTEFKKSISINIPKIIFINKYVYYDYKNYKKALNEINKSYFQKNEVKQEDVVAMAEKLRKSFEQRYHFPQLSYPYIFRFLDIISGLPKNNAIFEYETFDEIKDQLKRQWAGYLYDKLSDEKSDLSRKENDAILNDMKEKLTVMDKLLRDLFEKSRSSRGNISISLKDIENTLAFDQLKEAQEILESSITNILYDYDDQELVRRLKITCELNVDLIISWLDSLNEKVNTFKWSKTIPISELFTVFTYKYWEERENIDLENVIKVNALYKSIPENERNNFAKVISSKFEKIQEIEPSTESNNDFNDDIPF